MRQHKVMTVYGTRPEAIKVATVIEALERDERFESIAVVTGQHREMLDQVNSMFGITPKHDLDLMKPGQPLNSIVARAIAGIDELIVAEQPDVVIVQGDTSTAMAAAIAAFNRQVTVVHLEAGLRTGDIDSPFPEEANRKLISQVAKLHLAPTRGSRDNLFHESVEPSTIVVTGNTVIDALLEAATWETVPGDPAVAEALESGRPIILATTHRRENLGDSMDAIGRALAKIAKKHKDHVVILPVHRNPIVREAVLPHLEGKANVIVTEPLPYAEFTKVMAAARIVLTDSGGVQEEACTLRIPCVTLRPNTERPETVGVGANVLCDSTNPQDIGTHVDDMRAGPRDWKNPFGDGRTSERVVDVLLSADAGSLLSGMP